MQHGEDAGIGATSLQMPSEVDTLQPLAEHLRGQSLHPLVEVSEHHLRLPDPTVVDDGAQPASLVAALKKRPT